MEFLRVKLCIVCLSCLWAGSETACKRSPETPQSLWARRGSETLRLSQQAQEQLGRELAIQARERAWLYERLIEARHLESGMVVERAHDGRALSQCDSLLFSSLRFVALKKLGWQDRADKAWHAIERSYQGGRWIRHPQCAFKTTSRDMIIGLLSALVLKPPGYQSQLVKLLDIIEATDGSVDPGPFYVSRLSPGIAEILRLLSLEAGLAPETLPAEVRVGFSTLEWDSWWGSPGYTSHLNAMALWLERELWHQRYAFRSLGAPWREGRAQPQDAERMRQRFAVLSQALVKVDPENLFFQYLAAVSAQGRLTAAARLELLQKLLAMPQFPAQTLPRNCDRGADYLWQRSSLEYRAVSSLCTEEFTGVDFLWMVALLTDESSEDGFK